MSSFTMLKPIDFEECLGDTPRFRSHLEVHEAQISKLESHIEKTIKQCKKYIEAGRAFSQASKLFMETLTLMGLQVCDDAQIKVGP
ncbi:arf-GAP with coiled-coil, ANK repeat and PH domain-containing protein 2-like [Sycon ciliatum]|uniref:arf-GAP with coiled-coil, ANK repeat and PH domain-containing protein 2-like n=1 Tax=Sycon ciliatum TaxID=27933 RepID=UPI0031F60C39